MLRLAGKRCVVVGGGEVAMRRVSALLEAGGRVVVIAPKIGQPLLNQGVEIHERAYRKGDLAGAFLVVVATDDPEVNEAIASEAAEAGVLVNRADQPTRGDFVVPAHAHHGPVTLAVSTAGISAAAAGAIRRELSAALNPIWPQLLEIVEPYRSIIQNEFEDARMREQLLRQLTGPEAIEILKNQGPEGLRGYCQRLVDKARSAAAECC